jgi:hypothetical protein
MDYSTKIQLTLDVLKALKGIEFANKALKKFFGDEKEKVEFIPLEIEKNDDLRNKAKQAESKLDHPLTNNLSKRKGDYDTQFLYWLKYKNEIIGHLIFYPLNKDCVKKFTIHEYLNGAYIEHQDIAKSLESAFGFYIAYLISYKKKHSHIVLLNCIYYFELLINKTKRNDNLFILTKPSKSTLYLMKFLNKIKTNTKEIECTHYVDRKTMIREGTILDMKKKI